MSNSNQAQTNATFMKQPAKSAKKKAFSGVTEKGYVPAVNDADLPMGPAQTGPSKKLGDEF